MSGGTLGPGALAAFSGTITLTNGTEIRISGELIGLECDDILGVPSVLDLTFLGHSPMSERRTRDLLLRVRETLKPAKVDG